MDIYNKFANIYDELMVDFDYEKWFQYIEQLFERYNKTPKKILEMACGTGNLSYYLAREGYDLTCFDLSSDMLSQAFEKLRKFKNVKLLNQDMVDFQLNQKFDSIVSICDSINYITDEEDLQKSFQNVWEHLEDGGIFIFDINSYYKLKYVIGDNTFIEDNDDIFYIWQNYFDSVNEISEFYLTFFSSQDGENFERFDEMHKEKAYRTEDIIRLLENVGFKDIDSFEAFGFEEANEKSERIKFVAVK